MAQEMEPRHIEGQEATFAPQRKRLVPTVVFQPETEAVSLEERITRGQSLILIGLLELLQVREEIASATDYLDRVFTTEVPKAITRAPTAPIAERESLVLDHAENESFGTLMRRYRQQAMLSQLELSKRTARLGGRVDVTAISRIETNTTPTPRLSTIRKLAGAFGWQEDDPRFAQVSTLAIQQRGPKRQ